MGGHVLSQTFIKLKFLKASAHLINMHFFYIDYFYDHLREPLRGRWSNVNPMGEFPASLTCDPKIVET